MSYESHDPTPAATFLADWIKLADTLDGRFERIQQLRTAARSGPALAAFFEEARPHSQLQLDATERDFYTARLPRERFAERLFLAHAVLNRLVQPGGIFDRARMSQQEGQRLDELLAAWDEQQAPRQLDLLEEWEKDEAGA